ncbi:zinc finger HIT domain-containing protein 3 [Mixophyes fleayi]|uniref:zinc finger HIT domain-containing protein 3 n=1 Tax=Mixophyes fleayi TaxID=3061075 RepID=UPI003F4D9F31
MEAPCCVCTAGTAKYRCPGCRARYCSLSCCKKHKDVCVPLESSGSERSTAAPPTRAHPHSEREDELVEEESDTVPLQRLQLLGESEEIKELLLNAHVRRLLLALDQSEKTSEALREYMQEPLFAEFADKCLSLADTKEKKHIFED